QAEDGIRDYKVTGVQTCALPICRTASPDYFRTMGIPLLLGRSFTDADNAQGPLVAIVNEALVRKYLPDRNPLDQQLIVNEKKYRSEERRVGKECRDRG